MKNFLSFVKFLPFEKLVIYIINSLVTSTNYQNVCTLELNNLTIRKVISLGKFALYSIQLCEILSQHFGPLFDLYYIVIKFCYFISYKREILTYSA